MNTYDELKHKLHEMIADLNNTVREMPLHHKPDGYYFIVGNSEEHNIELHWYNQSTEKDTVIHSDLDHYNMSIFLEGLIAGWAIGFAACHFDIYGQ